MEEWGGSMEMYSASPVELAAVVRHHMWTAAPTISWSTGVRVKETLRNLMMIDKSFIEDMRMGRSGGVIIQD